MAADSVSLAMPGPQKRLSKRAFHHFPLPTFPQTTLSKLYVQNDKYPFSGYAVPQHYPIPPSYVYPLGI